MIKHILSGGFIYLMIVNAFPWMNAVIRVSRVLAPQSAACPALSPQSVFSSADQHGQTSLISILQHQPYDQSSKWRLSKRLRLVVAARIRSSWPSSCCSLWSKATWRPAGGVILLGFGGNRFTASAAEGYFPFVIRVGVRLLFFYSGPRSRSAARQPVESGSGSGLQTSICGGTSDKQLLCTADSKIMTTVCSGTFRLRHARLRCARSCLCGHDCRHSALQSASLVGGSIGLALASRLRSRLHRPHDHETRQPDHLADSKSFTRTLQVWRNGKEAAARAANRLRCKAYSRSISAKAAPMPALLLRPRY